jgi:hypothetical protein
MNMDHEWRDRLRSRKAFDQEVLQAGQSGWELLHALFMAFIRCDLLFIECTFFKNFDDNGVLHLTIVSVHRTVGEYQREEKACKEREKRGAYGYHAISSGKFVRLLHLSHADNIHKHYALFTGRKRS